jgi:hypothetical protein
MARFGNKTPVTGLQHPKHLGDTAIVIGQHRKNARGVIAKQAFAAERVKPRNAFKQTISRFCRRSRNACSPR